MDNDEIRAVLQHLVTAVQQLAHATPSGIPHVAAMAGAAQAILTPPPKPAPEDDGTAEAEDDEDEDDTTARRGPGRPRTVTRNR